MNTKQLRRSRISSVCCPGSCEPSDNNYSCCSAAAPCGVGEGDCDQHSHCAGDLVCGTDNCGAGADSKLDCCEERKQTGRCDPARNDKYGLNVHSKGEGL